MRKTDKVQRALAVAGLLTGVVIGAGCKDANERARDFGGPLGRGGPGVLGRTRVGPVPGPRSLTEPLAREAPMRDDPAARAHGRRLFIQYNCSGCHGGHAGGGMGPSLRDVVWLYGDSPSQVASSIAEGRAHGMPAWGARLPDDQIAQLTAYVLSLRTNDEPEPPPP